MQAKKSSPNLLYLTARRYVDIRHTTVISKPFFGKREDQKRAKRTRGQKLADSHRQKKIGVRIGDTVNKNQKDRDQKGI